MLKDDRVLKEGFDYYLDKQGRMVLTEDFLLRRGYCCGNGCMQCPYVKQEKVIIIQSDQ